MLEIVTDDVDITIGYIPLYMYIYALNNVHQKGSVVHESNKYFLTHPLFVTPF